MTHQTPRPLHILEIETFGRGGLAHYVFNLSRALVERGHRLSLVTAASYELEEQAREVSSLEVLGPIARGSRWLEQSSFGRKLPALVRGLFRKPEAVFDAFAVARQAKQLDPDVIHLHCTNPAAFFYVRALATVGRPLVVTAHVVTPHERVLFQDGLYRRIHTHPELIIAHSKFDERRLLDEFAVDPERVAVIPHGDYGFFERQSEKGEPVDRAIARRRLGLDPGSEVALFFGYIREYKGLDILLDAWPAVAEARPSARLVVAGDPVRLPAARRLELEERASRLGVVHHFGYIPFSDVGRYFAASDVLVMPYRHISQSGVLYLALSLGVPVVATRVGALGELLHDGESALLVPPENPEQLGRALVRVLGDTALRGHLAQGGRQIAHDHSWPAIAEQTERAFYRLAGAGADGG